MILVDVNIFCDCATKREGWGNSTIILFKVKNGLIKGYISALTIPLLYFYIKEGGFDLPIIREFTKELTDKFEVIPLTEKIIQEAYGSGLTDFEDAIQYHSAIEVTCSAIITRNTKDFAKVKKSIKIYTPEEYIAIYGSAV